MKQSNGAIEIDQFDALEGIDYMPLAANRRKQMGSLLRDI